MKAVAWLTALGLSFSVRQVVTFDAAAVGATPPGWSTPEPYHGPDARWEVLDDPSAPTPPKVFAQVSADPDANRFPLAIYNQVSFRDGDVSVRLKPVSGRTEQAAGIVFRYQDRKNFYLVRVNALDRNLSAYKVVDGRYIPLTPQGVRHDFRTDAWSILKVSARGAKFAVYVNHRRLMQFSDPTYDSGKAGLWTRADSVVYFDDFRVSAR